LDVAVRNGHPPLDLLWAENARKEDDGPDSFCWFSALKLLENGVFGKFDAPNPAGRVNLPKSRLYRHNGITSELPVIQDFRFH